MSRFPLHTIETAPPDARPLLAGSAKRFGFVPSPVAKAASSPTALQHLFAGFATFERRVHIGERERGFSDAGGADYEGAGAPVKAVPEKVIQRGNAAQGSSILEVPMVVGCDKAGEHVHPAPADHEIMVAAPEVGPSHLDHP